jgi:hypothetical protein
MHDYDRRMIERQVRKLKAKEAIDAVPPIPSSAAWLKPFCYEGWEHWPLSAPFTSSGHTWAASRYILLRMPVNPDVPVYEPGAAHENEYLAERLQQRPQGGHGIERLWSGAFYEVAMRRSQLPIDGVHLSQASVELLNRLPSLVVEAEPEPEQHYLSFRFDGGEGVVMRLSRPEPKIQPLADNPEEPF